MSDSSAVGAGLLTDGRRSLVSHRSSTLTHQHARVPLAIFVCISDTFENNFGIRNDFTKYLKEGCYCIIINISL